MGTELLATVVDSVDPTWIGAMLYTYPVQFIVWLIVLFAVGFFFGFMWEKRNTDAAKGEVRLAQREVEVYKAKAEYELQLCRGIQEHNKSLLAQNKELHAALSEANKQLAKSVEQNEKLIQEIELTR